MFCCFFSLADGTFIVCSRSSFIEYFLLGHTRYNVYAVPVWRELFILGKLHILDKFVCNPTSVIRLPSLLPFLLYFRSNLLYLRVYVHDHYILLGLVGVIIPLYVLVSSYRVDQSLLSYHQVERRCSTDHLQRTCCRRFTGLC